MNNNTSELKSPATITREELYAQVWETPMSRLATQYGITGNGLAKICRRLNVPYPPRGYWAKKAAGKKIRMESLPALKGLAPNQTLIRPTPSKPIPPTLTSELEEKVETARVNAASVNIPEKLVRPHPIIANWLADHKHQKQRAQLERNPIHKRLAMPEPFTASDHRRHRILNALFKILERQGGKIEQREKKKLFIKLDGEEIEFQLRDKYKQVRRPLTEDEKRGHFSSDKKWKQELQPTGKLVFSIKTYLPTGMRSEWLESDERTIEQCLPDIIATFVAAGPLLAKETLRRREAERKWRLAEQRRYEEQQIRKRDDNRWRRFIEIAHDWQSIETARRFLDNLRQLEMDLDCEVEGQSLREWTAWAEQKLQSEDPLTKGVNDIFGSIASVSKWTYNR